MKTATLATRRWWYIMPIVSAVFPYVTLHELMVESVYHLHGASASYDAMIQCDVWALSADESQKIARIIRLSMDGMPAAWDGLEVDGVFVESEMDMPEPAQDGSERAYYRRSMTLDIWHAREVPA